MILPLQMLFCVRFRDMSQWTPGEVTEVWHPVAFLRVMWLSACSQGHRVVSTAHKVMQAGISADLAFPHPPNPFHCMFL